MNIHSLYRAISPHFRRKRMRHFLEEVRPGPETTILDVGGSKGTWEYVSGVNARVTILNVLPPSQAERADTRYEFVIGDATALPYRDKSYDVVFSNSVIEHVGDYAQQQAFAREARRVGKALWVQTPARSFFIEPHLIAPFIHWLPSRWQTPLVRNLTVRGWMTRPTRAQAAEFLAGIRLLNYEEFSALFPGCRIAVERFCGLPKSYIAIGGVPTEE